MDQQQRYFQNKVILTSIIFATFAGFIAGGLSSDFFSKIDLSKIPGLNKIPQATISSSLGSETNAPVREEQIVKVVKGSTPAVVSIIISKDLPVIRQYQRQYNPFQGTPFENFFTPIEIPENRQEGTQKQDIGGGTGFVVTSDGLILTNKHVVEDMAAEYTVLTSDGQKYPAKVLARDPVQDIAVIKIDKNNLPTLKLGDSDKIEIGQTAIAIGNALAEFSNTVSVGVVSGLKRSIAASNNFGASTEQLDNVIQTDAAINPGNSGGPLINLAGEVIGINVAIAQGAQNIGFTLPINYAKRDLAQVKDSGKISYPYLGVRYRIIDADFQKKNNLSVDYGALIIRGENKDDLAIIPGGPADKAGLVENDIILEVDDNKITTDNQLAQIVQNHNVGDGVALKVLSKGKEKTVTVILEERK